MAAMAELLSPCLIFVAARPYMRDKGPVYNSDALVKKEADKRPTTARGRTA